LTAPEITDLDSALALKGVELEPSDWLRIDQARIDRFADATDDHQWIHCDVEKAAAGPYGKTIAHGFLTLSLVPALIRQIITLKGVTSAINYGSDKVRFLNPVLVDSNIRLRSVLREVDDQGGGRVRVVFEHTVEIEGAERPALVATQIALYHFA
jgi:acyl dehydratase